MPIEWNSAIAVGHAPTDQSNRRLIGLVNRLNLLSDSDHPLSELELILCDLADYLGNHFDSEEYLMFRSNYPEFERHKADHEEFGIELARLITDYERAPTTVLPKVRALLRNWIEHHIFGADAALGHHLAQRRQPPRTAKRNWVAHDHSDTDGSRPD